MKAFRVTRPFMVELGDAYAAKTIAEKSTVTKTIRYRSLEVVVVCCLSSDGRYNRILAFSAVPIELYDGNIKPLPYQQHNMEINLRRRRRGYAGMLVMNCGRQLVLVEEIEFLAVDIPEQIALF